MTFPAVSRARSQFACRSQAAPARRRLPWPEFPDHLAIDDHLEHPVEHEVDVRVLTRVALFDEVVARRKWLGIRLPLPMISSERSRSTAVSTAATIARSPPCPKACSLMRFALLLVEVDHSGSSGPESRRFRKPNAAGMCWPPLARIPTFRPHEW